MPDTFVKPSVTKLASRRNGLFGAQQCSFSLAPLGGMTEQAGPETVFSPWVQLPSAQSALDLGLEITKLAGTSPTLQVTVQTCRAVDNGNAVDAPRAALGGTFDGLKEADKVYVQCLALRWVRLQIVIGGSTPAIAFTVGGTGVPLGLS